MGVLAYVLLFRPLRNRAPVTKAVGSLGLVALMTGLLAESAGRNQIVVNPIFPKKNFELAGLKFVGDRIFLAVTIIAIAVAFAALSKYTRFGLATRASAESEVGALVSGLSPERIAIVNWALSAAVAGLAGILISPLTPLLPATYTLFVVPALAAAVLGNFSALLPAAFGGLAIGMLQGWTVYMTANYGWFPDSGAGDLVPLLIVLVLLVLRGRPLPDRGALVEQTLGHVPRPNSLAVPAAVGSVIGLAALLHPAGQLSRRDHHRPDLRHLRAVVHRHHRLRRADLARAAEPRAASPRSCSATSPSTGACRSPSPRSSRRPGRP